MCYYATVMIVRCCKIAALMTIDNKKIIFFFYSLACAKTNSIFENVIIIPVQ